MLPATVVTTPSQLSAVTARLKGEPILACDLEADSQHHYREKVCLLQISVPTANFVIDPLSCPDLSPLAPFFADPSVRKIFHGADYDVRSLHRDFGIDIANLFDTMIACQFLGEAEFGLAAVLRKRFGVELDKKYQKADWSRRPIPPEMMDYAVKDTSLLIPLYLQLEKELRDKDRFDWVMEECELLSSVRMTERKDEPLFLRFKGAAKMPPASLAVLEKLLAFRDAEAQRRDLPPFKILGTETIRELVERKPLSAAELSCVTGISPRVTERYGQAILTAIDRGLAVKEDKLPHYPQAPRSRRSSAQESKLKRLKIWRESKAAQLGIATGLLANNTLLEKLAENDMQKVQGETAPGLKEWQKRLFADEIALLR
jgi:ribonuclease D